MLADTDAFAPHRSSKTTADRFDVRTLLDEEELERYGLLEHSSHRPAVLSCARLYEVWLIHV